MSVLAGCPSKVASSNTKPVLFLTPPSLTCRLEIPRVKSAESGRPSKNTVKVSSTDKMPSFVTMAETDRSSIRTPSPHALSGVAATSKKIPAAEKIPPKKQEKKYEEKYSPLRDENCIFGFMLFLSSRTLP
jgi:hypothetical protein